MLNIKPEDKLSIAKHWFLGILKEEYGGRYVHKDEEGGHVYCHFLFSLRAGRYTYDYQRDLLRELIDEGIIRLTEEEPLPFDRCKDFKLGFRKDKVDTVFDRLDAELRAKGYNLDDESAEPIVKARAIATAKRYQLEITENDILYGGKTLVFRNYKICKPVLRYFIEQADKTVSNEVILRLMNRGKPEIGVDNLKVSRCIWNINEHILSQGPGVVMIERDDMADFSGYKFKQRPKSAPNRHPK